MPITFNRLSHSDHRYEDFSQQFCNGWQHPDKVADVKEIYLADNDDLLKSSRGARFQKYRDENGGGDTYLFHGTQRACKLGDHGKRLNFCYDDDCTMCKILWSSFKMKYAKTGNMFGPGIYTTPVSSKADRYAKNHYVRSRLHAMLICNVICTRPQPLRYSDNSRKSPDAGYNCVQAVTTRDGGSVEYPEIVVYRDEAIIPIGVVMYTREGWQS